MAVIGHTTAFLTFLWLGSVFGAAPQLQTGDMKILSVSPRGGSVSAPTMLTVEGSGLAGMKFCRCDGAEGIGEAVGPVTDGRFRCRVPPLSATATQFSNEVEVSSDGANWVSTQSMFVFYSTSSLQEIRPRGGPKVGGTMVTVYGTGFDSLPDSNNEENGFTARCRFGDAVTAVEFVSVDGMVAKCRAPSMQHIPDDFMAAFQFTLDGQNWLPLPLTPSEMRGFKFYSDAVVSFVSRNWGSADGGTEVKMLGTFPNYYNGSQARCKFGDESNSVVPAVVTPNAMSCITPPIEEGEVTWAISLNSADFKTLPFNFTFAPKAPANAMLAPPSAPEWLHAPPRPVRKETARTYLLRPALLGQSTLKLNSLKGLMAGASVLLDPMEAAMEAATVKAIGSDGTVSLLQPITAHHDTGCWLVQIGQPNINTPTPAPPTPKAAASPTPVTSPSPAPTITPDIPEWALDPIPAEVLPKRMQPKATQPKAVFKDFKQAVVVATGVGVVGLWLSLSLLNWIKGKRGLAVFTPF